MKADHISNIVIVNLLAKVGKMGVAGFEQMPTVPLAH